MSIVKNHTQAAAPYPIRSPAAKKRRQEVPPRLPVCVFYYPGGELLKKKLKRLLLSERGDSSYISSFVYILVATSIILKRQTSVSSPHFSQKWIGAIFNRIFCLLSHTVFAPESLLFLLFSRLFSLHPSNLKRPHRKDFSSLQGRSIASYSLFGTTPDCLRRIFGCASE